MEQCLGNIWKTKVISIDMFLWVSPQHVSPILRTIPLNTGNHLLMGNPMTCFLTRKGEVEKSFLHFLFLKLLAQNTPDTKVPYIGGGML